MMSNIFGCPPPNIHVQRRRLTKEGTLKTRTSSPSDHWQFWKRTIRRQESGLEPGTNHTRRYTHRRGTGCGIRPQWAALPLSYPVTYVQLEYTTRVTNVSFSYTIYHQMSITWIIHGKGKTTLHPLTSQERKKKGGVERHQERGHLKQGHQVHRTIGKFENKQSEGRSPDWNRA